MSLFTRVGESLNILDESPEHTRQIHISQPVLSREDFYKLTNQKALGFDYETIDATYNPSELNLKSALQKVCQDAQAAVEAGKKIIIISNRNIGEASVPIPTLLSIGAVHHHLVRNNIRTNAGLIAEAGDIWETHHYATVVGYGASAIYPFKVYEVIQNLVESAKLPKDVSLQKYYDNYAEGIGSGLLKILSKMGISTLQSYQSAQIFECVGLGAEVVNMCFKGTVSRIDGLTFEDVEKECLIKHHAGFDADNKLLEIGGYFQWKRNGEAHLLNPETIHLLQKSTSLGKYDLFKKYSEAVNVHQENTITLRSLFDFKKRTSIPIDEVEPASNIMTRFATGAMSFGSIS
ncbi:MAG: glutamate synthase central domain-containing protein, partial [Marinoscillum sp.]